MRPSCWPRSWSTSCGAGTRWFPSPILRVKGLVAADLTQLIAFSGFFSMFFYATLYMQEVLGYSPLKAGSPTCRSPPGSPWRAASPRS